MKSKKKFCFRFTKPKLVSTTPEPLLESLVGKLKRQVKRLEREKRKLNQKITKLEEENRWLKENSGRLKKEAERLEDFAGSDIALFRRDVDIYDV